ncbi:hypothetical protein CLV69_11167 [Amycolatopsis arida]|nr:hypothetical protein CLV69_11167 [Amycolatopsis arida]
MVPCAVPGQWPVRPASPTASPDPLCQRRRSLLHRSRPMAGATRQPRVLARPALPAAPWSRAPFPPACLSRQPACPAALRDRRCRRRCRVPHDPWPQPRATSSLPPPWPPARVRLNSAGRSTALPDSATPPRSQPADPGRRFRATSGPTVFLQRRCPAGPRVLRGNPFSQPARPSFVRANPLLDAHSERQHRTCPQLPATVDKFGAASVFRRNRRASRVEWNPGMAPLGWVGTYWGLVVPRPGRSRARRSRSQWSSPSRSRSQPFSPSRS